MTDTFMFGTIGAAGLGLAFWTGLWVARMQGYRRTPHREKAGEPDAPEEGLDRYQPLFRLLRGDDASFLEGRRSCPQAARQWERSQRRVARLYLHELAADFQRLHREARLLAAQSPERSQELLPRLFRQQVAFWRALLWIEIRLTAGAGGMARVNPEALVAAFEAIRREIPAPRWAQDQLAH